MRIWVTSLLWLISLGLFAAAQPPRGTADPSTIVIKPMRPGEVADKEPLEKSGFIVIRPNGKSITTTQVGDPKQPSTTAPSNPTPTSPPTPGMLNVPPPGQQPAAVAGKDGKPLFDYWFAVGIDGQRAGYVNWAAKEIEQQGKPFVIGMRYLNLTISRFGQTTTQSGEESSVETPTGTVVITSMRQTLGRDQSLALTGVVGVSFKLTDQAFTALRNAKVPEAVLVKLNSLKDKELPQKDLQEEIAKVLNGDEKEQWKNLILNHAVEVKKLKVKRDGTVIAPGEIEIPWPEGVVGLVRELRLFKELNLKIGESFDYPSYIPMVNWVVKTTIIYEGEESKVLWPNTPARKLLRFKTKPAPIGKVKLPASTTWVDAETFEPLQLETDFPALGGRLTFLRTTMEVAKAPVTRPVEVFNAQSIRLNREIPGIHTKGSVVYKVSVPRDDEPETVFSSDTRQKITNLDAKARTFELHVSASHGPDKNALAEPAPGKEFIASNYFINWDNDLVKAHAARAIAGLPANAGAWEKAVAVERWVKLNMKAFEFDQAMATADNVAKTLSGDCTEYAMLAAAMCRAVGVPSRTALGVVYAPTRDGKTFMAYHMWYEVYADGQWLPLDATLGFGGIGPGHIKITDHSWYKVESFAPLVPVLRSLNAKPSMEVLTVGP